MSVLWRGWEQNKNQKKPLGEDGGRCPDVMLPLWSYKSELLTPKPKAYHHLPSEGHHPRQGDKQGKTVLSVLRRTALQAETWWYAFYTEGVAPGYSW